MKTEKNTKININQRIKQNNEIKIKKNKTIKKGEKYINKFQSILLEC